MCVAMDVASFPIDKQCCDPSQKAIHGSPELGYVDSVAVIESYP